MGRRCFSINLFEIAAMKEVFNLKKKPIQSIVAELVSARHAQEQIYLGNKIKDGNYTQKKETYKKHFDRKGGCGCSQKPKRMG